MGHNRAGDNARRTRRRRLKELNRLACRADAPAKGSRRSSVLGNVTGAADSAAKAVGSAIKTAAQKVKAAIGTSSE